ncbi:MAG: precorrin-6y C5,15-methyltransferase (decarboxylating) subunit CbiE, partial [Paracoccaceae bacterium]
MSNAPWLTIVGLTEDGPEGLTAASLNALKHAKAIVGPKRHLALLSALSNGLSADLIDWPVPFADGLALLEKRRGTPTVALVSGDPFWFGAGTVIAKHFAPDEWRALANTSVFSCAAAHLGWPLETTPCLGLHAVPFARLRPHLAPGQRMIMTLRDGPAVAGLAQWLETVGFGDTTMHILEAIGGPNERVRSAKSAAFAFDDIVHPVAVAIEVAGAGETIPLTSGKADALFANDGQITKRP